MRDDVRVAGVVFEDEGRGMERGGAGKEMGNTKRRRHARGESKGRSCVCKHGAQQQNMGVRHILLWRDAWAMKKMIQIPC